jgi:hypothetical protein
VNRGTVIGADGLNGLAIVGEEGAEQIDNEGSFCGQVDLGEGANQFVNHVDGLLVPGPLFLLGDSANQLLNNGIMMPGDMHNAQHTEMAGSFVQSTTGLTFAELDFRSDMLDQIYMNGTSKLAGQVDVSLLNPQLVPYGHFQKVLFSADGGVTDDGMSLTTAPSVVINYQLLYTTGYDAVLDYNIDFSPEGALGVNLREVGDYFNRIQSAGSSPAMGDTVTKLLYDPNIEVYRESLSQLSPDFYAEHQAELIRSSQSFGQSLMDGGTYRFGSEGRNLWFNLERHDMLHEAYHDYKSVRQRADRFAMGFEMEFGEWTSGFGIGLEDNSANGYNGRWTSKGNTTHLGVVVARKYSATELSGSLSYSWNQMDSRRIGQLVDPFETHMSRDLEAFSAVLRASHEFTSGGVYLKPMMDLGISHLRAESGAEEHGGATSLVLGSYNESHLWIRPKIGLGDILTFNSDIGLHLHAEIRYQHYITGRHTDVRAGFAGAPEGVSMMEIPINLDSSLDGLAGVYLTVRKNLLFGLEYSNTLDSHYDVESLSLKMNIFF